MTTSQCQADAADVEAEQPVEQTHVEVPEYSAQLRLLCWTFVSDMVLCKELVLIVL